MDIKALREIIKSGTLPYKEGAVSFIFDCYYCGKRKLYIKKSTGQYICFHCASDNSPEKIKGGKVEFVLNKLYGIPINVLKEKLYHYSSNLQTSINIELKDFYPNDEEEFGFEPEEVLPEMVWDPNIVDMNDSRAFDGFHYLLTRGLGWRHVREYNLRYNPVNSRVIFPVIVDGRLLGWQGRYIHNTTKVVNGKEVHIPKIVTSTGLKKDHVLMFQGRLNNSPHCVLTEGPVSAIKAGLCGGNVASMGKAVSDCQLDIILKKVNKLYLGLDPDAASEIDSICRKLYGKIELYHLPPPSGREDLGDATEEEVFEAFKKAEKLCGQIFLFLKE